MTKQEMIAESERDSRDSWANVQYHRDGSQTFWFGDRYVAEDFAETHPQHTCIDEEPGEGWLVDMPQGWEDEAE